MSAADFHRQKLYDAERRAFREYVPVEGRTLEDVAARVHQMIEDSPAWNEACLAFARAPKMPEVVDGGRGRTSWASSGPWRLKITNYHRAFDWVLVHELAHLPIPGSFQAHGREFVELYLRMIEELMGPIWAQALRVELDRGKVPYSRTIKWTRQLRSYLRLLANPGYSAEDICVILRNGKRIYCEPRLNADDVVYLGRSYAAGTPESVPLEEVAYVVWKKVTDRRRWDY